MEVRGRSFKNLVRLLLPYPALLINATADCRWSSQWDGRGELKADMCSLYVPCMNNEDPVSGSCESRPGLSRKVVSDLPAAQSGNIWIGWWLLCEGQMWKRYRKPNKQLRHCTTSGISSLATWSYGRLRLFRDDIKLLTSLTNTIGCITQTASRTASTV